MASRYWIGGTGNWTDTAHWSTSSGGGGSASVPSSDDDVFFDASSFTGAGQIVTIDASATCNDMVWTGATNNPTFAGTSDLSIYGSLTTISSMSRTFSGQINLQSTSLGETITTGGLGFENLIYFVGDGGGWTLQDTLNNGTSTIQMRRGTIDLNGKTVTCGTFAKISSGTLNLIFGASTLNCTSLDMSVATANITCGTSTIKVTGTGSFLGGGSTYYNVELNGSSHTVTGSNTFTSFTLPSGTTQTITFADGTNQTITTPTLSGSSGHVHTLQGSSTAGWTITKVGGGQVFNDYISLSRSTGAPDLTWIYGANSTNGGNNVQWYTSIPIRLAIKTLKLFSRSLTTKTLPRSLTLKLE